MQRKYSRTNLFVVDEELWAWAQYKTRLLRLDSVSEYLFKLIKLDQDSTLLKREQRTPSTQTSTQPGTGG